ncbi:Protein phosphatase 1 regulatory subunit 3D [Gossypium arboreum]|uniref:Protein phosphatase 1 regulatory subunit 3D n=1 Tax=Gossypium arboreum TaxID=29729 RepID=A0A0B0N083_GOSAR|nr:Protein phosphatase 1 regulatory subunit 3D [Gossypium arboreum]
MKHFESKSCVACCVSAKGILSSRHRLRPAVLPVDMSFPLPYTRRAKEDGKRGVVSRSSFMQTRRTITTAIIMNANARPSEPAIMTRIIFLGLGGTKDEYEFSVSCIISRPFKKAVSLVPFI